MTPAALEARLRIIEPHFLIIEDRHLSRLLRRRIDLGQSSPTAHDIPHHFTQAELLDDEILNARVRGGWPSTYLVLTEPDDLHVKTLSDAELLHFYWRMLFGNAIEKLAKGWKPNADQAELFSEIRFILESDHRIADDADETTVWSRFLAIALTRAVFLPDTIPIFFPQLGTAKAVFNLFPAGFDWQSIRVATKPEGALDPVISESKSAQPETSHTECLVPSTAPPQITNFARSAISNTKKGDHTAASQAVGSLIACLKPIMDWSDEQAAIWCRALLPVLPLAASGSWPHAARLLFDLQTLAQDLAGELYAVDLPGYLLSWGKKPIQRKLTHARDVHILRKLASIENHLEQSHLKDADDHQLLEVILLEMDRFENRVRQTLEPLIVQSLYDAGIRPISNVETVAEHALVSELLDKICTQGFIRFGDLRDAIAKFGLKLQDLSGGKEWFSGDALLRADRLLAESLDGIYHHGEFYLRTFQRLSSLGFGNRVGRWATLYLILPFLGAFLTLEFTQHVVHGTMGIYGFFSKILAPRPKFISGAENSDPTERLPSDPAKVGEFDWWEDVEPIHVDTEKAFNVAKEIVTSSAGSTEHHGPHLVTLPAVIILGIIVLGLLHWPAFRNFSWELLKWIGRLIKILFYTLPLAAWNSEPARAIRNHPISRLLYRRFSTAIALACVVIGTMWFMGATPGRIARWTLLWFTAFSLFFNLPLGRRFEDRTAGVMSDTWKIFRINLLPGIVAWCMWIFRELVGAVERVLYAVDEWFRFRQGQTKPNIAFKAVLGLIWFPIAYIVRFAFNLLLEPQVNPIKHFPVVTVSHKVLFTTIPYIRDALGVSEATVVGIIWCIPGIFGFLAWEFRENWRLYRASRSKTIQPLAIGHHGESIRGLLRPGFHSGTIPKLFRKMRIATRKGERAGTPADRHKFEHDLHHIATAVTRLIERQFITLLHKLPAWNGVPLTVKTVEMTNQTITAELNVRDEHFTITYKLVGEMIVQIVSGLDHVQLTAEQKYSMNMAFAGLAAYAATGETVSYETWARNWAYGKFKIEERP